MSELINILEDVKKKIPLSSSERAGYEIAKEGGMEKFIEKSKSINFDITLSMFELAMILEALSERTRRMVYNTEHFDPYKTEDDIVNKVLKKVGNRNLDIIHKISNEIVP